MNAASSSSAGIRIVVVGLGRWGPNMVRSFQSHPRSEVVAAVEPSDDRRSTVSAPLEGIRIYSTMHEALASHTVDAVALATPCDTHFALACEALDAGKHLLVEKPLASSSAECRELVRRAREKGLILAVGHTFLFNDGIREARRVIEAGHLGDVRYLRATRANLGPVREDVSALWDLATHDISIFNYLLGACPSAVSCLGFSPLRHTKGDVFQATLTYPGHRLGLLQVSWIEPVKVRQVLAIGEKRMLLFDDMKPERPLKMFDSRCDISPHDEYTESFQSFRASIFQGEEHELECTTGAPLTKECHDFVDALLNRTAPGCCGEEGQIAVEILEAMDRSRAGGGVLTDVRYE